DIPIFAFTRHVETQRRVRLYRGVHPRSFDVVHTESSVVHRRSFDLLIAEGVLSPGDFALFTSGDREGIAGRTNTMQIIEVPADDTA
ncbi:MAG: pyruvate kinase alpha/beta domain-containing protein, partial [Gammaproteobacteria bacterium]